MTITELTPALLLFAGASTARFKDLQGDMNRAGRSLFIGLRLAILMGTLLVRVMR